MNGIDVERFRPDARVRAEKRAELGIGDETFVWLTVGSFRDDQKDYPNLLRAAAMLDRVIPWRIVIAGGGPLLAEMKHLAETLGVGDRVLFLGLRSDVLGLMRAADAFVLASWFEAMPIVLLEAGACALPAVVTDVGQNAAIIGDGMGLVVAAKDPTALASAMGNLLATPGIDRAAMGRLVRERVANHFSLDAIVQSWEERYETLLEHIRASDPPDAQRYPKQAG